MILFLNETFKKLWDKKDPFLEADKLEGKVFRNKNNRRTLQFELNSKSYFAKIHHGIGWKEIFKNLSMFKKCVISAKNEYDAIRKLEKLNIATMTICAFALQGKNPAKQKSFIITEDIGTLQSIEDITRNWKNSPPNFKFKSFLIRELARISRTIHSNGMNHRDYYICHFLVSTTNNDKELTPENTKLYLIDLHRAQIRKKTPYRWIVKDIAGLWFSCMNIGLSKRDLFRFASLYEFKEILLKRNKFWKDVEKTATKLYRKEARKGL